MTLSWNRLVTRTSSVPEPFSVPPKTASPAAFSTGALSPVTALSSTGDEPLTTSPSTGMRSPGRTIATSPTRTSVTSIATSFPSRSIRAVFGAKSSSCDIERLVRETENDSSSSASENRNTIDAASSYEAISTAPMTAMIISTFMSKYLSRIDAMPRTAM